MNFDALIIGGGVSGMQCALILGSAENKSFARGKKIGIITHQRASHLQNALFNNVLGLSPKTLGKNILIEGKLLLIANATRQKSLMLLKKKCFRLKKNSNALKERSLKILFQKLMIIQEPFKFLLTFLPWSMSFKVFLGWPCRRTSLVQPFTKIKRSLICKALGIL